MRYFSSAFHSSVSLIIKVERFERAPDRQVGRAVLVEKDVASALGRFGQVVDQLFLPKRQLGKARHLVAENFNIVEAVQDPGSILRLLFMAGNHRRCG